MKRLLSALVATLPVAGVAAAPPIDEVIVAKLQKQGMSAAQVRGSYDACDSGGPQSMKICFRYRLEGEEMRLDRVFNRLKVQIPAKFGDDALKWLWKSESAWQLFRDAHCNLEAGTAISDYGPVVLACQWQMTKQRADELQKFSERFSDE
jgi:uncharacterized protein YecT (DUF1311 family)